MLLPSRGAIPSSYTAYIVEVQQLPILYSCIYLNTTQLDFVVDVHATCANNSVLIITHLLLHTCSKANLCHICKCANRFIKLTLYSGHLIFVANKTWLIYGWIIEVPLYTLDASHFSMCTRLEYFVQAHVFIVNITTPTQNLFRKFVKYGCLNQRKQYLFLTWPNLHSQFVLTFIKVN